MLAFLGNLSPLELVVILALAVLIFGKNLPQAASKAYLQARKLRSAVDDLRRDTGIERELREIERNVREAEWEARRMEVKGALPRSAAPPTGVDPAAPAPPTPPMVVPPEPGPVSDPLEAAGEAGSGSDEPKGTV